MARGIGTRWEMLLNDGGDVTGGYGGFPQDVRYLGGAENCKFARFVLKGKLSYYHSGKQEANCEGFI